MLFDTHTHLNDEIYKDRLDEIINRALENDVKKMIVVGYDVESSLRAVQIANKYDFIYAAVGIHPSYINDMKKNDLSLIENMLYENKVVGVGEIGLDYFHNKENKIKQKEIFSYLIKLAYKYKKAIIIHSRDAVNDTLNLMKENKEYLNKGVMHCYSYSEELSVEFINLGMMISFGGPLTFLNSKTNKEIVKNITLNKLLIETDCPYLTPHPFRGKVNEPMYVKLVAQEVANLRKMELDQIKIITFKNACDCFGIKYEN